MALTKAQALEAVNTVLTTQRPGEMARLNCIYDALQPRVAPGHYRTTVEIPEDAPPLMRELARKSETNYLPLLVKTFSQVMKADGYSTASAEGATNPWVWWQRNRMDSRQTGITRSALSYGAAYATALPGTWGRGEPGVAFSTYSPRKLTALYQDPEADEWPMLAVALDEHQDGSAIVSLFDEELIYRFGIEPNRAYGWSPQPSLSMEYGAGSLTFIDTLEHGTGVTPIVRYRDRNLLAGEEQMGIVEPLMTLQERINETTFEMMVAQYFQAFKQRYVIGWVPKTEQEELKASAARMWYLDEDPADVRIDELAGGDVNGYITSLATAKRDFAALGQVPVQSLGVDGISNISDATLAGLEAAKNREGDEIKTSLGESHEQLLRLAALIDGNQSAADDYESEVRWTNFEARSFGVTVDGLGKLATMLGIPGDALVEDIPGVSGQRVEALQAAIRKNAARQTADSLVAAARGPVANQG